MMANGSAPSTGEPDYLSWPTATTGDSMSSGGRGSPSYNGHPGVSLTDAAVRDPKWTTPSASDGERGGVLTPGMSGTSLAQQVASPGHRRPERWATPKALSGGANSKRLDRGAGGQDLQEQIGQWRTPTTGSPNSLRGTGQDPATRREGGHAINLQDQASVWKTPQTIDAGTASAPRLKSDRARDSSQPGNYREDLKDQAGHWPTPTAMNMVRSPETLAKSAAYRKEKAGRNTVPEYLAETAAKWPTPTAHDGRRPGADHHSTQAGNLSRDAAGWSTPRSSDGEKGAPMQSFGGGGIPLPAQAINWPTPAARDVKGINSAEHVETNGTGKMHLDQLPNFVEYRFPHSYPDPDTALGPQSLMPIPFAPLPSESSISGPLLAEISAYRRWSMRSGGAAGWRGTWTRKPRRSLNPKFVDWLMGMPIGLSGFARPETEFSRYLPRMRGLLLAICSRPTEQQEQGRLF
jgi:hypothetical protein